MRALLVPVLCLASLSATAVSAQATSERQEARTQRVLYVCETSNEARRAFRIEHGSAVYMTAEEVLAAQSRGERWTAPRCITAEEAQRLQRLRTDHAERS